MTRALYPLLGLAWLLALVSGAGLAAGSASTSSAQNAIESLEMLGVQDGTVVVRIGFREQPPVPAGFTIANPPRIAFDFVDTANALGKNTQELNQGDIRSMNVVQAGDRTRLVLNLSRPLTYDTKVDGKNLLILLKPVADMATTAAPTAVRFAESKAGDKGHAIRDVDFRRGPGGEGRVVVDLSDTSTGIDIRRQGRNVVVEFINTALPATLERRLDVVDFATPVQFVDTFGQGGNVRMVVEPKGNWEHSAFQADNKFILEVRPIIEDPARLGGGIGRYTGDRISLNFQNVDVRAVLQVIADFTGLNIITSDTVSGNLTIRLRDVPWDQALDIILDAKGLDQRKRGNVVWIAPKDELATKEKLELEARQQIAELEPTRTEAFTLNYQKAEDVKKLLTDDKQKMLSKRGSAVADVKTNTLFVKDHTLALEEVRAFIKRIDVAQRQVLIEARIVEATDTFVKNVGVRLGHIDLSALNGAGAPGTMVGSGNTRALVSGTSRATGVQTLQTPNYDQAFQDSFSVNLPIRPGIFGTGITPAAFTLSVFNSALTNFLNLEIQALESDGRGKVISSPRVVTADQVKARIEQGTEIPYLQASSSGATSVSFKKAVLSLEVTPQITPEGNILMKLLVNKDRPRFDQPTVAGVPIDTKQVDTTVLVDNGGTVVIGGIYEQTQTNTVDRVPVLGELPVIGWMFRNTLKRDDRAELLVFITPKVLQDVLAGR
ncbi:MAG TPA: type IV pilus secretin PilQ [Burkholderiales bacterium]|nr:type IV pilus secretin PilQ [Burkholderiales bacterium]